MSMTPHITKIMVNHEPHYRLACCCDSTNLKIECIDKVGPMNTPLYQIVCQDRCSPSHKKNMVGNITDIETFSRIYSGDNESLLLDVMFDVVSYFKSTSEEYPDLYNLFSKLLLQLDQKRKSN